MNHKPRTRPLETTLAEAPPVAIGAEVEADGLVEVEPALNVVSVLPETDEVEVETDSEMVVRDGKIVEREPVNVVKCPSEEKVDGANVTMLLPGRIEPAAEETTEEPGTTNDWTTVAEVAAAGGGAISEVEAGEAGAAEHSAVTVTVA